ncbi:hypothetical protein TNCV_1211991 [Trichonephila clavipes]|nr:hypothetical protein TNCV_1211991 [Trichonephila clavipes]
MRANVRGAHSSDTRHLTRECSKNTIKTPLRNARSNKITAKGTELEFTKEVVTARVSISVPFSSTQRMELMIFDLLENVQLFDFGNQRDFESTKDEDIEFRKEMEELRKETENETRIREARHKEEEQARLKAEEETKAVEDGRRKKNE